MRRQSTGMRVLVAGAVIMLLFSFNVPEAAASKKGAARSAIANTVNLYCQFKSGNTTISATGSGVVVHDRGIILTNAHVAQYFLLAEMQDSAKGTCSVRTGSPAKKAYSAKVLYIPAAWMKDNAEKVAHGSHSGTGEHDFAFLSITGMGKESIPAAAPYTGAIAEEADVTVAGYPSEKLNFKKIQQKLLQRSASSTISNIQTFRPGKTQDVLTIASSPMGSTGVSGGPVFDSNSNLIGIVATKSAAKDDRALRAISLSYIDRSIKSEIGMTLDALLITNAASRGGITKLSTPETFLKALQSNLRNKKK